MYPNQSSRQQAAKKQKSGWPVVFPRWSGWFSAKVGRASDPQSAIKGAQFPQNGLDKKLMTPRLIK